MKKNLLMLCTAAMLLAGCSESSDDNPEPVAPVNPAEKKIPINISTSVWSRATDNAFEKGDKAGIYVVNYKNLKADELQASGNYVDNMCFTYSDAWNPDAPIYWLDEKTHADFYCYYPYTGNIADISACPFNVQTDQSTENNYKASEFMWGKRTDVAPVSNPVQINVRHSMSNLIVCLKAGKGYKEEDLAAAKVTVCGLKSHSTVNLKTGIVTASGDPADITPLKTGGYYRALVVPQTVSDAALIRISINGQDYLFKQSITFESNKQHTCTVTVNKTNNGINIGIEGWETDNVDHGGIVE